MNKLNTQKCLKNLVKWQGNFFKTKKTNEFHITNKDEERKKRRNEEEKESSFEKLGTNKVMITNNKQTYK